MSFNEDEVLYHTMSAIVLNYLVNCNNPGRFTKINRMIRHNSKFKWMVLRYRQKSKKDKSFNFYIVLKKACQSCLNDFYHILEYGDIDLEKYYNSIRAIDSFTLMQIKELLTKNFSEGHALYQNYFLKENISHGKQEMLADKLRSSVDFFQEKISIEMYE